MRKAVIMAGGFGTRLRPLTMSIPKPMVPLANRPMMEHIVELLKTHGIHDVVSLLYFQPEHITSHFEGGEGFGISMRYMLAEADFGTAGSVKNAQEFLNERFIIISGDVLTDFDLSAAIAYHESRKAAATIVLTRVEQPLQYGIVMTDGDGRITRFLEKPSWGEVFSDTINTGIYILEPEVLDLIPAKTEFDFSKDLFPLMLAKGLPLYGYIADGYWKDIGNLNEYQLAHADVLAGKVKVQFRGEPCDSAVCGTGLDLSPSAHFDGLVVLGDNVHIGAGAQLTNCIIGNDCRIGEGARLVNTVVWDRVIVGNFSELTGAVICNDVLIGDRVNIADSVFVAERCEIGDHARLASNIKLWPRKIVESHATVTRSLVQEERWARELFTDARISGVSNIDMNPEFGAKLGAALGCVLGAEALMVGSRDDDAVSRIIKRSITAGLMSVGVSVDDLQLASIPMTRQEMKSGRYKAGFHIRRSPYDPQKTDIIIFGKDGRDIALSTTKSVDRFFYGEDIKRAPADRVGRLAFPGRAHATYIERFLETIDAGVIRQRRYKTVIDYTFGLASSVFPQILGELGCRALSMNAYVDTSHTADDVTQALDESGVIMRSLGYEIGFKIDAGGERISMIDDRGISYSGLRLLSIVAKLFLESHRHREPYAIAVPVLATQEVEQIATGYNVEVRRIRNSHGAMMEATKDENVLLVGGVRGGFIFPEFLVASDGMYAVAKILEMLAQTEFQISELDLSLPKRYQATVQVPCPWEAKGTVMRRAMEHTEGMNRQLVDGVKIFDGVHTVLLVPDRESATFMVAAESDRQEEAIMIMDNYATMVAQWRDGN
jgi:mannose-1-phosphate guanylyltransferase/phosphomannomutase